MGIWQQLFNLDDDQDLDNAINRLKKFREVYNLILSELGGLRSKYVKDMGAIVSSTKKLEVTMEGLKSTTKEGRDEILKNSQIIDKSASQYDALNQEVSVLDKSIEKLTKEQEDFNKSSQETLKLNKEKQKLTKKLSSLDQEQAKDIAKTRVQIQERNKALKQSARESLGLVSLYEKEAKRLVDLRKKYKNVALAQGENSKAAKNLQKEVIELDEKLKSVDESAGQFQRSVGDYPDLFQSAVGGVKSFGTALKGLLANPIGATFTALIAVLSVLFAAWKKTAAGARIFAKAGALVDGLFTSLVGVADNLAKGMVKVFEDPLGALKEFGSFLVSQVINRFSAIPLLLKATGSAFSALANRDVDALKKSALDAGKAIIQLNTGLDASQQQSVIDGFNNLTDSISDTTKALLALEEAQFRVKNQNRELQKEAERLTTTEEKLNSIRDDATKSFAEREAASENARITLEKRTNTELKLAKNNLDLINAELKIRKSNGEDIQEILDRQLDSYVAFVQAEREYTLAVRENEKERDQLKQDRLEKDLDILIDGFDNQKSINERIIADDKRVLDERRALFDQTRSLSNDTFDQQIKTIQQFTDQAIDANDLLAESDAVVLNEKIRQLGLSEIIEGRLLEVIRERRTVTQDLADIERDLAEAEKERVDRLDSITQRDLDRLVARKQQESEFGAFSIRAINERVDAEIAAEEFRAHKLLENEKLLAKEREEIREQSAKNITKIEQKASEDRVNAVLNQLNSVTEFTGQAGELFSALGARRTQVENERLENLEEQRERDLEANEGNKQAQEAIEKRFDRQKEAIEKKQAARARRIAIFQKGLAGAQSIIDTASAVNAALANPPGPPFSIPQAIAAGIFGGIRTAAIFAQPIPAFAKGTDNAPGGVAWVGEKGRELIVTPDGKLTMTGDKAHLMDVPAGSQILTNSITENIIKSSNRDDAEKIQQHIAKEKSSAISSQINLIMKRETDYLANRIDKAVSGIELHQYRLKRGQLEKSVSRGNTRSISWSNKNKY